MLGRYLEIQTLSNQCNYKISLKAGLRSFVLQINLRYDLVGNLWLASIQATVVPGGSSEGLNDSCQQSTVLGKTMHKCAEMQCFSFWGICFFVEVGAALYFRAMEGAALQLVGTDFSFAHCRLYSPSCSQGTELF